ncbi:MAG: hypothetical protein IKI93_12895 [Clostridia bacterium]|nr:hypothetical protein [Clostridia bacterium]
MSDVKGAAWEFFIYINNRTSKTLEIDCKQLDWGTWYRNSTDDASPIEVQPGEAVQALGIRAAHGTATGYECRCTWVAKDTATNKKFYSIDLKIDVPYSTNNSSTLTVSGPIRVEGWTDLPKSGHNFTRSITISELDMLHEDNSSGMDMQERAYYDMLLSNNEAVRDWTLLQNDVTEQEQFNPCTVIPEAYNYPPRETFIARSKKNTIQPVFWSQLHDPVYTFEWQKKDYVDEYFSVAIYTLNTNPRNTVMVPKGVETVTESSVEVTSSIKSTLEEQFSIRTLLNAEYSGLTAELEATYGITHTLEESYSRVERKTETVTIGASEKNRLFVPWVFSTILAVYRKKKNGQIDLIGISEWAEEVVDQVYEYGTITCVALS